MGLSISDYMPLYARQILHAVVDSPQTLFKKEVMPLTAVNLQVKHALLTFSRIILVYYYKCCNLIGYSTRYLFIIR